MGAWGPGIFSDDAALDAREIFRMSVADGMSTEEATKKVLENLGDSAMDSGDATVLMVALAVTQWKSGRLLESVRDRAVELIDSGRDLSRWSENSRLLKRRQEALNKARTQILSPQGPAVRMAKPTLSISPFGPGDVVVYTHNTGTKFVFWIYQNSTDLLGTASRAELLDVEASRVLADPSIVTVAPIQCFEMGWATKNPRTEAERVSFWMCQYWDPKSYEIVGRVPNPKGRTGSATHFSGSFVFFTRKSKKQPNSNVHLDRYLKKYLPNQQ